MTLATTTALLTAPVAVPLATAAVFAVPARVRISAWAGLASPAAILGCGVVLTAGVTRDGPVSAYGRLLRADSLTVWMLLVIGTVATLACAAGPAYLAHERAAGHATDRSARQYNTLVHTFLAAMAAAVLAANLGLVWVAIEATTIVTAFLVGHRHPRPRRRPPRPRETATWPPRDTQEIPGSGVGIVEGWRGTITTRVELAPDGTLRRVKPADPSFFNWPALPVALAGTIVPDFPLVNKSFNLSYAGNDL